MSYTLIQFANEFGMGTAAPGIANVLTGTSIFMQRLRVKKAAGLVEKFGQANYDGGVATRAINQPFPATDNADISPMEERLMIAGAQCKTDVRIESASQGRARASTIARRTRTVSRYIDYNVIRGPGKTDQKSITGLNDRLTGRQLTTMGDNGGELTLDGFHALIDSVEDQGGGRFVLASRKVLRNLKDLLIASAAGATLTEVGNEVMKYEGIDLIPSGRDHAGNELLDYNETLGDSNATSSMYCIAPGTDIDETGVQLVMATNSIEVIQEGIRDSQHVDTIEVAVGFAIYQPRSAARLAGILAET